VTSRRIQREEKNLLRKLVDEQSKLLNDKAYKGYFAHRPKMERDREKRVQSLLNTLSGKSGRRRSKLMPKLNKFTRNIDEFKRNTHDHLKGDALIDLKFQVLVKEQMDKLRRRNMQLLHLLCAKDRVLVHSLDSGEVD